MQLILSEEDRKAVLELRGFNILMDVKGHLLDQKKGIILISCADGDQFYDIFSQKAMLQKEHCGTTRIHTFSWNGGAMRLASNSPANKPGRSICRDFLDEIYDTRAMKSIDTIALYSHTPCGKARSCGLNFIRVLDLQMSAKTKIKAENQGVHVACFCHIDYGHKKRTYFISRDHWFQWRHIFV